MATLTHDQLAGYLSYIGFNPNLYSAGPSLAALSALISRHIATVPFETLSLHYSQSHTLSLNVDDLYNKMVGTGRGGYCMELNALFGAVLRTLGYQVYSTGGRVSYATGGMPGDKFMGW